MTKKLEIPRNTTNKGAKDLLKRIYKTKDKNGLRAFIEQFFGVTIPNVKVCKHHDTPMDFVADIFFQTVKNVIAVANRTGGKTQNFATLNALNWYFWDDCEVASVGAIEAQAMKCYRYFSDFVNNIPLFTENLESSLMSKTHGKNKSMVQILTGTMSGVNSPHPQKALLDEVELMMWNVLQEAFSMAQSKGDINGQTIITSSRKFAFGPMERLLKESEKRGFKVYIWCVRESIEPHLKSEVEGTELYEDFKGYYDKDGNFPSNGYLQIRDVISAKRSLDHDTWQSQWLCDKPMATALVYPQFDERIHVKHISPDLGKKLILAEDFGFAEGHADVVGFWQVVGGYKPRLLDEIWIEGLTDEKIIDLVEDKIIDLGFVPDRYKRLSKKDPELRVYLTKAVEIWYCPPEEPSKIQIRQSKGYRVAYQPDAIKRRLENGIPIVRQKLEARDENGDATFLIDPKCKGTIGEMGIYSNKMRADGTILDQPNKINDNGPDMIRYFFINELPIQSGGGLAQLNKTSKVSTITGGIVDMEF